VYQGRKARPFGFAEKRRQTDSATVYSEGDGKTSSKRPEGISDHQGTFGEDMSSSMAKIGGREVPGGIERFFDEY
jgi:hypothetical protein